MDAELTRVVSGRARAPNPPPRLHPNWWALSSTSKSSGSWQTPSILPTRYPREEKTGIMRRQPTCPEIGLEQEPHLAGIWKYLTSPVLSSDERVKRRDMIQ